MSIPDNHLIENYFSLPITSQQSTITEIITKSSYKQIQHIYYLANNLLSIDIVSKLSNTDALHILSYLDAQSLCRASKVNRKWHDLATNDSLWYLLCREEDWLKYGMEYSLINSIPSTPISSHIPPHATYLIELMQNKNIQISKWKEIYIRAHLLNRNWRCGYYSVLPPLKGHTRRVNAFDCQDGVILSAADDSSVLLWDSNTLECKLKLEGHSDSVNCVKLVEGSRFDSRLALTGCSDGFVRLFNAINGNLLKALSSQVTGVADNCSIELLDSNREYIVGVGDDFCVRIWELFEDCELIHFLPGHKDEIQQLILSGNIAITCSWDTTMRIWNVSKGFNMQTLSTAGDPIMCCDIGEGLILGGGGDGHVRVWHANTLKHLFTMSGHDGEVYCIGLNSDVIVSGGADSTVRMYSHSGVEVGVFHGVHIGIVRCVKMQTHRAITSGDRKVVAIWDTNAKYLLNVVHRNPTLVFDIWCDDTKIITGSPDSPGILTVIAFW
ncbi:hypothetical protein LOD99_7299 [Oopsacas minuta]|uniref:F-box domain-containing protein n=1 Tax=Oopsacas minuta TaxID=111878 RepID=A0AAV7JUU8_9METZ|nr:hypothetical protein LOD99_7299 [Oopsacas minuta]